MKNAAYLRSLFMIILLVFSLFTLKGEIRLPRLLSDHVVLQRDTEIELRGWSSPGERVSLQFKGKEFRAKADGEGNWVIRLPSQEAGGPYDLVFKGGNEVRISDVLFGDVWICAGQSNMVLPMERVREKYPDVIESANKPEIRNFFIPTATSLEGPLRDLTAGNWVPASPENVPGFGAVSYFFARSIHEKCGVPVGLINASVGGSPIEAWIGEGGLKDFPEELARIQRNSDTAYIRSVSGMRLSQESTAQSQKSKNPSRSSSDFSGGKTGTSTDGKIHWQYMLKGDLGLSESPAWFDPEYVPEGWHRINIPGYWEDQGIRNLNGVVWYRREIDVPASMCGVPAKVFMGRIVDADVMYINGQKVGNITYQYPPRRYGFGEGILKPGKNIIVIRVSNYSGKGGFVPDKPYVLRANGMEIDLKGDWLYKVGRVFEPGRGVPPFSAQDQPASLFNAMVAPLTGYPVRGFLWYQGEANAWYPDTYEDLLKTLITDWRKLWGAGNLPFLYVQLANFMDVDYLPTESSWAELRDAQLQALSLPNTAMTVAIDLGEWNDIHPLDKKDVGERLALSAMNLSYGEKDIVYSGPLYRGYRIDGNRIIVEFDHCGGGLVSGDGESLHRFGIAGGNGKYRWAYAEIKGNSVVVWNEEIENPRSVRYAWADNPMGANLYNREGLPASPFRTLDPDRLNDRPWQGRKCAVVLTYDDAIDQHLDNVIPALDSLGLRGTFYIPAVSGAFHDRLEEWKAAAAEGHELGNHTLFHPCDGTLPGREWVSPGYDLSTYTVQRMIDEILSANRILEMVDGGKERTFAFTCGDRTVGGETFMEQLQGEFPAARGVQPGMHTMGAIDLYNIDCYPIAGQDGDYLVDLARQAMETGSLVVFLFHGVGGGHSLNVSLSAHRRLLQYLSENEDSIWTGTMIDVARNIRQNQ